jgi:cell wall-associated NlpC family hydrolase
VSDSKKPPQSMAGAATAETLAPLDSRRNAFRPDIAAKALEGRVRATRFVEGRPGQIIRAAVPVRRTPDFSRGLESEALFGEALTVFDEANGWAWVQLARDRYVGYVPSESLTREVQAPTHRIQSLATFLYPVPDIKSPPIMHLPMNALLTIRGLDEKFAGVVQGGFVVTRHIGALDRPARDFVEIAERFVGVPYLWGGRTRIGIDCSGLVQTALQAAGIVAPRDSDMQQAELGQTVLVPDTLQGLERGDLVFWPGHVAIMTDSEMMVHANAHHMSVVVEPLPEASLRIARTGNRISAVKRLSRRAV